MLSLIFFFKKEKVRRDDPLDHATCRQGRALLFLSHTKTDICFETMARGGIPDAWKKWLR